jgi:3-hydroxyisobutyrate dehydrogenase-like beta-hydroxyacid dehydrogenase
MPQGMLRPHGMTRDRRVAVSDRAGNDACTERSDRMSDVSIIGLGAMGAALARALMRAGHGVVVWNRTQARAEPLVHEGATLAADAAAAVAASPMVIVCVNDYEVTREILSAPAVRAALSGRVLVQLSTGTPNEARAGAQWAQEVGAGYLDGAILAYPDQMGTPEAALLVAGPLPTFQGCEPLLRSLAGGLTHVGEQVGAASALECAALSFIFGAMLGALHGARICEVEGLPVDEFGGMLGELMPVVGGEVHHLTARIQSERYDGTQAALRTYAAAAVRLVQQARDGQIPSGFPAYASSAFQQGVDAGLGDEDLAALIKAFRSRRQP